MGPLLYIVRRETGKSFGGSRPKVCRTEEEAYSALRGWMLECSCRKCGLDPLLADVDCAGAGWSPATVTTDGWLVGPHRTYKTYGRCISPIQSACGNVIYIEERQVTGASRSALLGEPMNTTKAEV